MPNEPLSQPTPDALSASKRQPADLAAGSDLPNDGEGDTAAEDSPDAQRVSRAEATEEARSLLRDLRDGVLGTLSRTENGAPFGSVVPYGLDRTGAPLIYIAGIAEHTRNLKADSRVSLLVHQPVVAEEDIQTKARLCVMGVAAPVSSGEEADAWARYRSRLPAATDYQKTHDFSLWRIEPKRMRWIGGFGEIFWLRAEDFRVDSAEDGLREAAPGIIEHMNEDHGDAIVDFYRAERGSAPQDARMVGVDTYGMDFESPSAGRLRVDFLTPSSPDTVRHDVIAVLKRARNRSSSSPAR